MTLIEQPSTYKCDKCGKEAPAPAENKGYPDGWGIYEYYANHGSLAKGDLCPDCMKLILPEKK